MHPPTPSLPAILDNSYPLLPFTLLANKCFLIRISTYDIYRSLSLPLFPLLQLNMKSTSVAFFLICFFVSATLSLAIRPAAKKGGGNDDGGVGGFFGPGGGFNVPGFGPGWGNGGFGGGYGSGFGGPSGGYSKGGIIRPTVVCKDKGPCYNKKLTCPTKCFSSYSHAGKGYGSGGGGGGCTIDCKKKCSAYC